MGQHINPFLFEGEHLLRVIEKEGEPWFFAKDVCECLGNQNPSKAVQSLDEDEKGLTSSYTLGGSQDFIVVSEGGLYTLIIRSRQATTPGTIQHRFRKWVTGEVLPSIRKTGSYGRDGEVITPNAIEARPFPDWPMEEMRTKKQIVDMYRMSYGSMTAQWIAPQLGFPTPPIELVEHGRQYVMTLIPQQGDAH